MYLQLYILFNNYVLNQDVDPGGPVVIILASGFEVLGFDPGQGDGFFQSIKILSMTSFAREVKPCYCMLLFT